MDMLHGGHGAFPGLLSANYRRRASAAAPGRHAYAEKAGCSHCRNDNIRRAASLRHWLAHFPRRYPFTTARVGQFFGHNCKWYGCHSVLSTNMDDVEVATNAKSECHDYADSSPGSVHVRFLAILTSRMAGLEFVVSLLCHRSLSGMPPGYGD